jgi:hypothetical protein
LAKLGEFRSAHTFTSHGVARRDCDSVKIVGGWPILSKHFRAAKNCKENENERAGHSPITVTLMPVLAVTSVKMVSFPVQHHRQLHPLDPSEIRQSRPYKHLAEIELHRASR